VSSKQNVIGFVEALTFDKENNTIINGIPIIKQEIFTHEKGFNEI